MPRYSSYRASGVDWLGNIPAGWTIKPLKRLADFINGDAFKPSEWAATGTPIIRIQNLNGSEEFNFFDGEIERRYLVHDQDLLFGWSGNRGTSFGPFIWRRNEVCALNQHIFRVLPRSMDKSELYWILKAVTAHVEKQAHGIIGMVHITKGDLGAINVPVPSQAEQEAIARFLDCETAKIDALVDEQRRLIELLKEKRQTVISQAVTKGLNPNVSMRDSGVEWLGKIPAHWGLVTLKRLGAIRYGIGEPPKYQPEGVPLIRATNVHAGKLFDDGLVFVDPEDIPAQRVLWLAAGDIIVVRSGAYTGDSAIIPEAYGRCIAGFDMVFRCSSGIPQFLQFALLSSYLKCFQIDLLKLRAAQPHLNAEELGACLVVVPPDADQADIVRFLLDQLSRIDALIAAAGVGVKILRERRAALISAAVTGKIDVRGLVPQPEAVAA